MKKFFGSSSKGNGSVNGEEASGDSHHEPEAANPVDNAGSVEPPNETTRLLPDHASSYDGIDRTGPAANGGYLSPDDPAVSPYNLFSVRVTRYFTLFLLFITSLWWICLLISTFVTPPGFQTRGSPFFAFSYASISLTNLLITLLFFSAPSKFTRVLQAAIAHLLLVNTIIIAAVQRTRHEEAWIGIATVAWAFFIAIWTIIADYTVQWGKTEEETRLTGRAESRRTLLEWIEVSAASVLLIALCAVSVLLTCTLILRALDAGLAPLGTRYWVDGGKYEVHVYCHGTKSKESFPTVLIEGGEAAVENGLWQFAEGALKNGSITRYCFADRPGFAWSDTAPSPFSAGQATEALSEALAQAGEVGPWVLLSAGIGTAYSRVFSSRHGAEIEGILLIDPVHEDLLHRIGSAKHGFYLWLRGILAPLGIKRIPGALFRGRNKVDRVWGRAAYQGEKNIFAKLQESLVANSLTKREVITSRAIQYQDTRLVVVTSGEQIQKDKAWESKQRDLTHITHNLIAWDIVEAPHEVWKTLAGRETIEKRLKKLVHFEKQKPSLQQ